MNWPPVLRFPLRSSLGRWPAALAVLALLAVPCLLLVSSGSHPAVRDVADTRAAAVPPPPDLKPNAPQDGGPGLQLLEEAAQAGSNVSYHGVEMVSATGVNGQNSTLVANVWHRSGGDTLVQATPAGVAGPAAVESMSDDPDSQTPEGVLGVTGQLVALLGRHYDLAYTGSASADSRPAELVEAVREDGSLAARFWLDTATKLPLRREVFDAGSHLIGEDAFIDLTVGSATAKPPTTVPATTAQQLTAVDVTEMRGRGWPAPDALPGQLALFEADVATTRSGPVLDLGYSDGLYVVSVFVQRGNLAPKLTGYQKITLAGRTVYAGQPDPRSVTWAGHGFVFTVMADAPRATLDNTVGTLPYDPPRGFWDRLSHGFGRMATLANPFR
ncbi:MAG TPA: sigma-E factor regulatory protein RseB domain-containing protein [Streptosporangiaceae bacterium]|nr:sigma-E factor regulatory protein RseB domain-containing protein [Streptosporangiaceae bacterium]